MENPNDCHQFYVCFDNEPLGPLDCPDGSYFDGTDCTILGPNDCEPSCGGGGGVHSCTYECGPNTLLRADRYDCSTYHDCASGAVMQCENPQAPFFDGKTCQSEEKYCCYCKPYCYAEDLGHKVMDPTDCTQYYVCMEASHVPQYPGHCAAGNFDFFTQECSTATPCFSFCTNVVQADGCIDRFTCERTGSFAACPDMCTPKYYHCSSSSSIGTVVGALSCNGNSVFDPNRNTCVDPSECSTD